MKPIVIDPSMAAAWTLEDEKTDAGDKILNEAKIGNPITCTLFWYEYRSILLVNQRRGRVQKERIPAMLREVHALEIEERRLDDDQAVISLAFQHDLSAYDAAYLALALQENAILASNDRKLLRAAIASGLEVRTVLDAGTR